MYVLIETSNEEGVFQNTGLTNENIGEISGAEKSVSILIDEYIANLRLKIGKAELTAEEYLQVQIAIKTMENFKIYMHELPIQKQEYERRKIIEEAEKKSREEAAKARGE